MLRFYLNQNPFYLNQAPTVRIAAASRRYPFEIAAGAVDIAKMTWILDSKPIVTTRKPFTTWQLAPGEHRLGARVRLAGSNSTKRIAPARFRIVARTAPGQ